MRRLRQTQSGKSLAWTLCALLSMASSAPASAADLRPFEARYELSSGTTTVGEMRLVLERRTDQDYRYTATSRATGLIGHLFGGEIVERSEGTLAKHRIRPQHYAYQRTGHREREVLLRFDWAKSQVINTVNDDPWVMAIPAGTLDKLAVQLALMIDLGRGQRQLDYAIADGGKLKRYHFEVTGRETLDTPLGAVETLRIRRDRGRAERYTLLWCAPRWDYAPIRVVQFRKGEEHARLSLRAITTSAQPSP